MSSITASHHTQTFLIPALNPFIKKALLATLLFNLIDIILTLSLVLFGLAVEANPIMAVVLESSPTMFVVLKLALVFSGVMVLWKFRKEKVALIGTVLVTGAYGLLMVYHLRSVSVLADYISSFASLV